MWKGGWTSNSAKLEEIRYSILTSHSCVWLFKWFLVFLWWMLHFVWWWISRIWLGYSKMDVDGCDVMFPLFSPAVLNTETYMWISWSISSQHAMIAWLEVDGPCFGRFHGAGCLLLKKLRMSRNDRVPMLPVALVAVNHVSFPWKSPPRHAILPDLM